MSARCKTETCFVKSSQKDRVRILPSLIGGVWILWDCLGRPHFLCLLSDCACRGFYFWKGIPGSIFEQLAKINDAVIPSLGAIGLVLLLGTGILMTVLTRFSKSAYRHWMKNTLGRSFKACLRTPADRAIRSFRRSAPRSPRPCRRNIAGVAGDRDGGPARCSGLDRRVLRHDDELFGERPRHFLPPQKRGRRMVGRRDVLFAGRTRQL